ncbi:MAG: DUF1365 domain-containing protein [Gemmatimonadota bacterium]
MRSGLYECRVMHHRVTPRAHRFWYRIFLCAFDLDEIDQLAAQIPFFSRNGRNLYAFRDRDHLTLPGLEREGVKANVVAWLATQGVNFPDDGRIVLVTLPRILGYVFNPVSFYFCSSREGTPLCAIAEVGNTFGELKPYLVRKHSGEAAFRERLPKHFYVSPFLELGLSFDFRLSVPGTRLAIRIDDWDGDTRVLRTSLTGRRSGFSTARLAWFTVKYPFLTLRVIALIHLHAAALWIKRIPWYRKAQRADLQRDVYRPHTSIRKHPV